MGVVKRKRRLFPVICVLSALALGTLLMIHASLRFLEHDHQAFRVMSEGQQGSFNGGTNGKIMGRSVGLDIKKESYAEKSDGNGGTINGMDDGASADSWTKEEDGWRVRHAGGGKLTIHEQLPGSKTAQRVFKFFDAGDAYHDMNLTCPVAWEWIAEPREADAMWFNILDMNPVKISRHHEDQKLVWYTLESSKEWGPQILKAKSLYGYDYQVDYRIWPENPTGTADIPAVYLQNPTAPGLVKNLRSPPAFPKREDAFIAAFISNCAPLNNRQKLLNELMQHMNVHSYGRCKHNKDEPDAVPGEGPRDSKLRIAGRYYFIFAPENANEYSYVTEKIYDVFETGALPIYIGAPDINKFIPDPLSIINVADFNSTSDLIAYLLKLTEDPDAYMKHFEWKRKEFPDHFKRVLRLATRTVQCRVAMSMAGLDFEEDQKDLDIFPLNSGVA